MSELKKIEGKTFLITGGASGLGAGYVEAFLENGAQSVAILDISEQAGKALQENLSGKYSGRVIFIQCDVSNEEGLTQAFNKVVNQFKTVDVIINNAGIMNDSTNSWRKATDVNFQGLVSLTLKGIKHMNKEEGGKGGTIINIASTASFLRNGYLPIYSGAKAGVLHFTQCIAPGLDNATGMRVIAMCFGGTDTQLIRNLDKLAYDSKFGKHLIAMGANAHIQKAESAINGVIEAFKRANHKSVWLAKEDKPVQDITPVIDSAYNSILKELYPLKASI